MGMSVVYMMMDEKTVDSWTHLESDELSEALLDKEEDDTIERIDLDKNWDILHYYLTGESASEPIEGDKLSEAIVGVHLFSYKDDTDFISYTENNELPDIISSLKGFDEKICIERLEKGLIKKKDIYPQGIEDTSQDILIKEINKDIEELISFYEGSLVQKQHVVVSIL